MIFGVISYGVCAAAFLLLTALLISGWDGWRGSGDLVVASGTTAIWAALLSTQVAAENIPSSYIYLAEIVRGAAWLAALSLLARNSLPNWLLIGSNVLWMAVLAVMGVASLTRMDTSPDLGLISSRGALAIAISGLIMLEQVYRNAKPQARPALKLFLLGVGGMFAYDVYLYSQVELIQRIDRDVWDARGLVYALGVPLIILAVKRSPERRNEIFVSRQVVFHTTAVLGVGMYLFVMSLGGFYVWVIGGTWGRVAQILLLLAALGALGMLGSLVFSGQLRRRLSVFIAKHFYRNKYDYRVEWLRFIGTLSENTEGEIKRTAIRAVAQIFDSPGGVLLLREESGRTYAPAAAWPASLEPVVPADGLPANDELVGFLARRQWIIDLEEYVRSPDVYDGISIPAWIRNYPEFRVISPMFELDQLTGIFLLCRPSTQFKLTYEDRDLLKMVGRHVATQVAQHEADRKLAEARQFEAYNKLTAFMMHDLKNCAAQLRLLVSNAERHKGNPDFVEDAFSTIDNAAGRMTRLIEHMERKDGQPSLHVVNLYELAGHAIRRCSDRMPVPRLEHIEVPIHVRAHSGRLEAIFEHVIRNAQDASALDGTVEVEFDVSAEAATLIVADQGEGMTATFVRDRLFRPFDSTKGSKGMGIGAYQTREYVRMLGGEVKVQSMPGNGTRFSITLPRCEHPATFKDTVPAAIVTP